MVFVNSSVLVDDTMTPEVVSVAGVSLRRYRGTLAELDRVAPNMSYCSFSMKNS